MEEQVNGVPNIMETEVNINTNPFEPETGSVDTINMVDMGGSDAGAANTSLPTTVGFWGKVKAFLFKEIVVELTPYEQQIENELNDFLFQEISFFKKKKA